MDSQEPFKNVNSGSSSSSDLSKNNNSRDSPQEESPYCRYVSSLSPINIKASHGTRCFLGLSSPPPVFKSPRISHRGTQFMQRPQGNQSHGEVRYQSENGGNILGHDPLLPQATLKYHDVGKGCGNLPLLGSKPSGFGLQLNSIANAMPTNEAATTGVRLPDSSPTMKSPSSKGLQRREKKKATIIWSKITRKSSDDTKINRSHSPLKKKKKTSVAANQDGCKRCGCKKSQCIQFYCECFHVGLYCTGFCGCEDCLNRPEYEYTVKMSKQQIEYRYLANPKSRNEGSCSCIKCTCVKNYCPCYQAKVGCSSGCQCEGCKNSYGKKEDYVEVQDTSNDQEMVSSDTDSDLELLSPIKPPESLGGRKRQGPGSDCRLVNMIVNEMMKLPTLTTSLKVNSTSQKRVSPPQSGLVIGSSSSGGLREGRRIILQSVPPFPPSSPSVDSKSSNNEDQGNTQSKGPHSPSR